MPAHNTKDRTGEVYNYWTIVSYSHTDRFKKRHYLCRCKCGSEITKTTGKVVNGKSKSCGCLNRANHIKHGLAKSGDRAYNTWACMKCRCNSPGATQYKYYGGRGIKVTERWNTSFLSFIEDMGQPPTPDHTIDRIDVNGDYEPSNCRWLLMSEQSKNRRSSVPYGGELTMKDYCQREGLNYANFRAARSRNNSNRLPNPPNP